ncbi:MAG: tetratricopeptide repeat protein [Planctomycetota bacterium]
MTVKPANHVRRILLASLIAGTGTLSTGCTTSGFSMASLNPFSKSVATPGPGVQTTFTDSIANKTQGASNQVKSVGMTAESAWSKTKNAVAGVFSPKESAEGVAENDPLSLANMPTNIGPEVYVAQGQLWESTGDFTKAMESYAKALENEASNGPALASIARLHFRQGNHKQAAEYFQQATQQSPEDAGLHNDLGLTYSRMGNHAAASQSLQRALEIKPGTSRYANNLASVKFQAGEKDSAYNVLAANNKPAVAHFNMAYLHFKNGQMLEAKNHLGQAMQSQPQAASDAAVQRAVDRSRDLMAKIDSTMAPIAQAAPQATIAGGQMLQQGAAVKQTSQSSSTPAPPQAAEGPSLGGIGLGFPTTPPAMSAPAEATAPASIAPASTPTNPGSGSTPFSMPGLGGN